MDGKDLKLTREEKFASKSLALFLGKDSVNKKYIFIYFFIFASVQNEIKKGKESEKE